MRLNAEGSAAFEADVPAAAALPGLAGVVLPEAESAATLERLHARLPGVALLPLVESAAGLDALKTIAAAPGVLRLVVGHIDFMADTGLVCDDAESELLPLRFDRALPIDTGARETPSACGDGRRSGRSPAGWALAHG